MAPRRLSIGFLLIITLSLSLPSYCAPPQFSLDKPSEKTFQCVRSRADYRSTLASANCIDLIEDTVRNRISDTSRRNHPENTWLIPPPVPPSHKANNDEHSTTCRLGLFCTNLPRASPGKLNSTLLALHAALNSPTSNQKHENCTSAVAASLNIIAPPPLSSLYGWLPSPAPVLAEPNHCGVWFMTEEYFEGELGGLQAEIERGGGERWRVADDIASVAVGRGLIYKEVDGE